jgi:hypothetical protein
MRKVDRVYILNSCIALHVLKRKRDFEGFHHKEMINV